jgi:pimeloyl-ACP methyl ester carboxylesterase
VAKFDIRTADDARAFAGRIYHREPWYLRLVVHELGPLLTRRVVRELLEGARADHAADEAQLGSLPMPVTLVWGKSERLLPPSALAWFRRYLPPHAKILEPEGFSHSPHLEHPRAVSEHILRFLREA